MAPTEKSVPILLVERFVTYKEGEERTEKAKGRNVYLFPRTCGFSARGVYGGANHTGGFRRHAEQMPEDLEPMALGEFGQFGNALGDEGHGLVRAALPIRFIHCRSLVPARSSALSAAPCLAQ